MSVLFVLLVLHLTCNWSDPATISWRYWFSRRHGCSQSLATFVYCYQNALFRSVINSVYIRLASNFFFSPYCLTESPSYESVHFTECWFKQSKRKAIYYVRSSFERRRAAPPMSVINESVQIRLPFFMAFIQFVVSVCCASVQLGRGVHTLTRRTFMTRAAHLERGADDDDGRRSNCIKSGRGVLFECLYQTIDESDSKGSRALSAPFSSRQKSPLTKAK